MTMFDKSIFYHRVDRIEDVEFAARRTYNVCMEYLRHIDKGLFYELCEMYLREYRESGKKKHEGSSVIHTSADKGIQR
mgnify:CR=1 FL=1